MKPPRPPPRPPLDSGPLTQRTGSPPPSLFDLPSPAPSSSLEVDVEPPEPAPAELDAATRKRVADAIAKAVSRELGAVLISSAPPPRSSLRVAAAGTSKLGKVGTIIIGALAVAGQLIVWFGNPHYAGPIELALKVIGQLIAGGGPPSGE